MTDQATIAAATAAAVPDDQPVTNHAARKRWLSRLVIAVAVVAALWAGWWYFTQRGVVSTDNAYVNADMAQVTPLVGGAVADVRVIDTQRVARGDVLFIIDDADARVELAAAEAALLQARQQYRQATASGTSLSAQVGASSAAANEAAAALSAAEAERARAADAYQRRLSLAATGAVSGEEVAAARTQLAAAEANRQRAAAGVAAARANTAASQGQLAVNRVITAASGGIERDPMVAAAQARVDAARLALARTVVRAPIAGVVTQRRVQVGQRLAPGAPVMTIVPIGAVYVEANLKEGQLRNVRVGQPVELVSDLYGGDIVFHGRVIGIGGGTGAAFSVIPAQNATGNWVKVVQRLPVRIAIEPRDLAAHPLRVGLSMEVEIDTRAR